MNKVIRKKTPKKNLSLQKPEGNLQKHPSAKGLCNENGEILTPSDTIKSEILTFTVKSNSKNDNYNGGDKNTIPESVNSENENNKGENKKEKKKQNSIFIQINTCEHKEINDKESFFIETPNIKNNNNLINDNYNIKDNSIRTINNSSFGDFKKNNNLLNINNNLKLPKPLFYGFDTKENNFDKEISNDISEGKMYKDIENKFLNKLKKQEY